MTFQSGVRTARILKYGRSIWAEITQSHVKKVRGISKIINATRKKLTRRSKSMTWGDLYKRFVKEYPKAKAVDYRPFVEGYLPTQRQGIIICLENGDVLVYMPKVIERTED